MLLVIILILFILYALLVLYYWLGWTSVPDFIPTNDTSTIKISVIIPARNEEGNIGELLHALHAQTYASEFFEVIVVDDHSTDATVAIVKTFPFVKLISLTDSGLNSYKKKAVETGVAAATGELIVATDADCQPSAEWLQMIASFKEEKNAVFIAAPVVINCNSSVVQIFQAMDFMMLQGVTGAAVHRRHLSMCNGANLAYDRSAFYEVDGFAGVDDIASGDDMLLMHKIAIRYPGRAHYLKSTKAIVRTAAAPTWKAFLSQRIRWASKAKYYDDKRITAVLSLVYFVNVSFLILLVAGFWSSRYWTCLLLLWVAKTMVELPLFCAVSSFFDKRWANRLFFFFQPLHILYTIVSGLFGQFGRYEWKGRSVK